MNIYGVIITILIHLQLILPNYGLTHNPVPELVRVRHREDAPDPEHYALDFIGLVEEQGRQAEEHTVTTKDGYKLKLSRVPPNPSAARESSENRVVYLGHALAGSSDYFVMFGPGRSLVYMLSDAGYDVWIGNLRGNSNSREHVNLSPAQPEFWNFSLDEYATIDLPTMIDYTINYTGQKKISYIGHSLGTTLILMLFAEKPEYVQKFDIVIHFAPVAYQVTKSPSRWYWTSAVLQVQQSLDPWGTTELGRQSSSMVALTSRFCTGKTILKICFLPVLVIVSKDPSQIPIDEILPYLKYWPSGTSGKAIYHYVQIYRSSKFRKYDYGNVTLNTKYYGQPEPPSYNLSHIDVPQVIFTAQNDPLSTWEEARILMSHFHPKTSILHQVVPSKSFNHLDFVTGKDVKRLVYDRVLEILDFFHKSQSNDRSNSDYTNNGLR